MMKRFFLLVAVVVAAYGHAITAAWDLRTAGDGTTTSAGKYYKFGKT